MEVTSSLFDSLVGSSSVQQPTALADSKNKFPQTPPPKFPKLPPPDRSSRDSLVLTRSSSAGDEPFLDPDIDRSLWRKTFFEKNTEARLLAERMLPWERSVRFVQLYKPGKLAVKLGLDRTTVVGLILQHLQFYGFSSTVETLEKEANESFPYHYLHHRRQSHLLRILRNAFQEIETVYDLALVNPTEEKEEDTKQDTEEQEDGEFIARASELEEHFLDLELISRRTATVDEKETTPIWRERSDETTIIMSPDYPSEIKAGTLNKLVERLTAGSDHDLVFMKTFLMTLHSFATPEKVLEKLIERFDIPDYANINEQQAVSIKLRVGNVIKKWIEEYSQNDFDERTHPKLIQMLRRFINRLESEALKRSLRTALEKARHKKQKKKKIFTAKPPEPKVNMKTIFTRGINLFNLDEEELARQETILEFDIYSKIQPSELLNQSWSRTKYKHRSPNVLKLIARFNNLSTRVGTSILRGTKVKQRAKIMGRWIKMMGHLRALNNFNGTMAVMSGLTLSAVHRLKWTKNELQPFQQKILSDMEKTLSSERSYAAYRETLATTTPPLIPYLGVYLTDLTFIDENADTIGGLINFSKRKLIYSVISKVQQYQLAAYNLTPVSQVQDVLREPATPMDEAEMFNLSLKLEPRKAERADIE